MNLNELRKKFLEFRIASKWEAIELAEKVGNDALFNELYADSDVLVSELNAA